jgi:hypothetical protein
VATRRHLLRATGLLLLLGLAAAGGWAVRPYLPAPRGGAADAPATTEGLIERLEGLRAQKEELRQQEKEIQARRTEIAREEQALLGEIKKQDEENGRRLMSLGHRNPAVASRR